MTSHHATVLVADDVLFSMSNKLTVVGIYQGDIIIPTAPMIIGQLAFLFFIEGDLSEPLHALTLQVTLPGQPAVRVEVPLQQIVFAPTPDRTKWLFRVPMMISQPILLPGRIEAKAIYEGGEILVTAPWIALPPLPESAATTH
jgi:hypothetical protein